MRAEDLLAILRRIVRDFSPLLPGMRLEVVSSEAFRARLLGKPILPGEALEGLRPAAPPQGDRQEEASPLYPLHAFPSTSVVMVDVEGMRALIAEEDRRLQRVLTEGMILREVIYLATSRQPFPDPRSRAETILRRHWPFQYAALRSVGLTVSGFERPATAENLAKDN